jgi:hypothetical protein
MGNHGTPTAIFRKALERGNLVVAEVTALEIGRLTSRTRSSSPP